MNNEASILSSWRDSAVIARDQVVIVSTELAALLGVSAARLESLVMRHRRRFPSDFASRLTAKEAAELGRPASVSRWVFTEAGVIAACMLVKTPLAIAAAHATIRALGPEPITSGLITLPPPTRSRQQPATRASRRTT